MKFIGGMAIIVAGVFLGFFSMAQVVDGGSSAWGLVTALAFFGAGMEARRAFSDAGELHK